MKKFIAAVLLVSLLAACASAPEPEPTQVETVDLSAFRQKAEDAKAQADSLKAAKGAPETYAQAQDLYSEARSAERNRQWDAARAKYEEAEQTYLAAFEEAKANREAAIEALEKAQSALSTVEQNAAEARREAGLEEEEE
jgi:membrane-bound lytic murein transglycosylase